MAKYNAVDKALAFIAFLNARAALHRNRGRSVMPGSYLTYAQLTKLLTRLLKRIDDLEQEAWARDANGKNRRPCGEGGNV